MTSLLAKFAALDDSTLASLVSSAEIDAQGNLTAIGGAYSKLQALVAGKHLPRPRCFVVASAQTDLLELPGMAAHREGTERPRLIDGDNIGRVIERLTTLRLGRDGVAPIDYRKGLEAYDPEHFIGRTWLEAAIAQRMNERDRGCIVVSAGPGFGKTAFLLNLVETYKGRPFAGAWLGGWHFFRHQAAEVNTVNWDDPLTLVQQIEHRLREQLDCPLSQDESQEQITPENAARVFKAALRDAATRLGPEERLLIVVDGLDESYGPRRRNSDELARYFPVDGLPERTYLLVTSRPGEHLTAWLGKDYARIVLDQDGTGEEASAWRQANEADLRDYLTDRLTPLAPAEPRLPGLIERMVVHCEGSFYVAQYFVGEEGRQQLPKWLHGEALPRGIDGTIRREWHEKRNRLDANDRGLFDVLTWAFAVWHYAKTDITDDLLVEMLERAGKAQSTEDLPDEIGDECERSELKSGKVRKRVLAVFGEWLVGRTSRRFRHTRIHEVLLEEASQEHPRALKALHQVLASSCTHWQDTRIGPETRSAMLANLAWHTALGGDLERALPLLTRPADQDYLPQAWAQTSTRPLLFEAGRAVSELAHRQENAISIRVLRDVRRTLAEIDREPAISQRPLIEPLYNRLASAWPEAEYAEFKQALVTAADHHPGPWLREIDPLPPDGVMQFNGDCFALWPCDSESEVGKQWPGGRWLVTGDAQGWIHCFDAEDGSEVWAVEGHELRVLSVTFSPDGRRLASASAGHTIRLWDVNSRQPLGEPLQHEGGVTHVIFSPDCRRLASASHDCTVRLWDADSGQPLCKPLRHNDWVTHVAFSPDGRCLTSASGDRTVRLWNTDSCLLLGEPMRYERKVTISPDGRRLASTSVDRTVRLWDVSSGRPLGASTRHGEWVRDVSFSPDGRRLASASIDGTVHLWDADNGQPLGEPLQHKDWVRHMAFSPDGRRLTTSVDCTVHLWDADSGQTLGEHLRHNDWVKHVAFSSDGRRLVSACDDHTIRLWDTNRSQPLGEHLLHTGSVRHVAISPDDRRLASASGDGTVRLSDADSGEPWLHMGSVTYAAFSPDGRSLASASDDRTVRLWDIDSGQPLGEPLRHEGRVNHVTFSPDSRRLASASKNSTVRLWDADSRLPLGEILWHKGSVWHVAFSPDGRLLASASSGGTLRLWDAESGQPLGEPMRHEFGVAHVAFSPDGGLLVSASDDRTVRLWDVGSGQPLGEPMRHEDGVMNVAFSPDGRRLVSASRDGTVRLWDAVSCSCLGVVTVGRVFELAFRKGSAGQIELALAQAIGGRPRLRRFLVVP